MPIAPATRARFRAAVDGPMAAWGRYDLQGSRRLTTYLLFVEWWELSNGYHALWCYCDPKRTNEWTVGSGLNPNNQLCVGSVDDVRCSGRGDRDGVERTHDR